MSETTPRATVPDTLHGRRLDQALELLCPEAGLRERKRLLERGLILVDGRPRPKGYRVQAGQELSLALPDEPRADAQVPDGVRVVGQKSGFMAAVFKPAGVHSALIAGRPGPSVQAALEALWPGQDAALVNRLDLLTTGLVLVALNFEAREGYRSAEAAGQVRKSYLALVHGHVDEPFTAARALDMAKRRKVALLEHDDPDPLRHTRIEPLRWFPDTGLTLVRAVIARGARHQIRAHLAGAGHPIEGDPLYGQGAEGGVLYLHHGRVGLPGFEAAVVPDWPEWAGWELAKADL